MNISIYQTDIHSYRYITQSVLKVFPRLHKATFILKIYIKRCGETQFISIMKFMKKLFKMSNMISSIHAAESGKSNSSCLIEHINGLVINGSCYLVLILPLSR